MVRDNPFASDYPCHEFGCPETNVEGPFAVHYNVAHLRTAKQFNQLLSFIFKVNIIIG